MSLDEIFKNTDRQMAENKAKPVKVNGDRRVQEVAVKVDRRTGQDRRVTKRGGPPQRESYASNEAYNKAYDCWAENQR